jgi:DNA-binding PadR family transcriptional regulator
MANYKFLALLFEELFKRKEIPAKELKEKFSKKGLIKNNSDLRKLYYYLENLEKEGLVESKTEGREKVIISKTFKGNVKIDQNFLGFLSFLILNLKYHQFKELREQIIEILKHLKLEYLLETLEVDYIDLREDSFKTPLPLWELLGQLIYHIRNKTKISIYTKQGNFLKLIPLKLFREDWKIYLVGLNEKNKTEKVLLNDIKGLTPLGTIAENNIPNVGTKTLTSLENPFIFGIAFHKVYLHGPQVPEKALSTQFFIGEDDNYYFLYFVGFTDDRFAQKFLTILYDEILEPSPKMLKIARSKKLKKEYPNLTYDLEENLKRFLLFLECVEKHLDIRNAIVKRKKLYMRNLFTE